MVESNQNGAEMQNGAGAKSVKAEEKETLHEVIVIGSGAGKAGQRACTQRGLTWNLF